MTWVKAETRSGHPDHVLSKSSGSDLVYKLSGSDPDSTLDHKHWRLVLIKVMNQVSLMVMMEAYLLILLKIFESIDCTIRVF